MAYKVIDVSYHNGTINWEIVKNHINGVILRCGYGDNITSQDDKQWRRNADECTRLGIPFGVYLYSYAKSIAQAKSEAEHVLRLISGYKLSYPVYYDLEEPGTEAAAVQNALTFCEIVEQAGYMVGIYANNHWFNNIIGKRLDKYTKWIARYSTIKPDQTCDMWQYSSDGAVPGISGKVDVNTCYRKFPAAPETPSAPSTSQAVHTDYAVMIAGGRKLPFVRDMQDCAGIPGKPIVGLIIKCSKGYCRYRVHLRGKGWLPYVDSRHANWSDPVKGWAGDGVTPIDAVEVYYYTPDNIRPYKRAKYRVSPVGGGYYDWQYDNETGGNQDGYAGDFGRAIDRFQLIVE